MRHIILAEDDTAMRHFLAAALTQAGYGVTACADGLEALKALETDAPCDLLLTDVVMPGIDGMELARKASMGRPDLKVMFITGFSGSAADGLPDAPLVMKPFHLKDLIVRIKSVLNE